MAPPPRRPTAFEVSFPDDFLVEQELERKEAELSRKRKLEAESLAESSKLEDAFRRPELPARFFTLPPSANKWVVEANFRPPDEDAESEVKHNGKPVRVLTNFCIFDATEANLLAKAQHQLVLPDAVKQADAPTRFAVGIYSLFEDVDEDVGQDDHDQDPGFITLHDISLCAVDYADANAPIFIETKLAYYELRDPLTQYGDLWANYFMAPRRMACSLLAQAADPRSTVLRGTHQEQQTAIPYILEALEDVAFAHLKQTPLLRQLLGGHMNDRVFRPRGSRPQTRSMVGNPDIALLRPENQLQTHVTPLILKLARPYFTEQLHVIGARAPPEDTKAQAAAARNVLKEFMEIARNPPPSISYPVTQERSHSRFGTSHMFSEARIGNIHYRVGEFVLVRRGPWREMPAATLELDPVNDTLPRKFWFGRIVHFNSRDNFVHLRWLTHGSELLLGDMAHPQELYYTLLCEDLPASSIVAKIDVSNTPHTKPNSYFARRVYDSRDASFTDIDHELEEMFQNRQAPHGCVDCHFYEKREATEQWKLIRDDPNSAADVKNGILYRGFKYHTHEFLLFRNEAANGPAHIGYIKSILVNPRQLTPQLELCLVLRISELKEIRNDPNNFDPERHLVLTDERRKIPVTQAIRPIHVYALSFFRNADELERWTRYSPYNFYVHYRLPSQNSDSRSTLWPDSRQTISPDTFYVCEFCPSDMFQLQQAEEKFDQDEASEDVDCLDLFGGTGAFSWGISEGTRGWLKPTHLVEITPSAARTAQKNSPNLSVYCQDANKILEYCIKSSEYHTITTPAQNWDNKTPVPPPMRGGKNTKMRAIFAGLPCQSHSGLNMFRKAEDKKGNLILTTLSYIDFFRPTYVFLENVPGFLRFNLGARQTSIHTVEGGEDMGGLALTYRALLEMDYQVRCGLLQAGSYGAAQNRIRFFLVAAKSGHTLPKLPQPTHDFPVINQLSIKLPYGHKPPDVTVNKFKEFVFPINTARGRAAHAAVTIEDAIGDLREFDWKHPNPRKASQELRRTLEVRKNLGVLAIKCDRGKAFCGLEEAEYKHMPRTSFQKWARARPTQNLQHFTRCLLPRTVERVIAVPLKSGADYRDLPSDLRDEYQSSHALSFVGRNMFRGNLYGRLNGSGYFPTTVTNIHPTAKQSKVLHPNCLRMVSVRELARSQGFPGKSADWFVFEAKNNNIITMHRQIGNAVPFPVSRALGRELRSARLKDYKKLQREDSSDGPVDPHGSMC
ncbi:Mitogen-activated protein kinase [Mycena indigotica]|uniref:DNA (cytosine-5-)-methyltransferase n=1 Tax=Mycena indigotica TaxID=2126181 RepID=A0A8H6WA23_9AGAR|nr:Mitogen-activated protein kinase [Mycena indigotica]KAF7307248.1 Mitogen-activated protein kinase [Mycena indigotica]